ncbi:hypothetical protein KUDE01_014895, partial [Dissostichus eleginoides]
MISEIPLIGQISEQGPQHPSLDNGSDEEQGRETEGTYLLICDPRVQLGRQIPDDVFVLRCLLLLVLFTKPSSSGAFFVGKSSINPLKETFDTAEHQFKPRLASARLGNGGHRLRDVPHARSFSEYDARRSVLPSKLVALATLSSDLNMVAFQLKNACTCRFCGQRCEKLVLRSFIFSASLSSSHPLASRRQICISMTSEGVKEKKHTFPPYTHILVVMYVVFEVTVAVEPQGELQ